MKAFTEPLKELGEFESIRESLKKKKGIPDLITVFLPLAPVHSLRDILWMHGKASLLPHSLL